MKSKRESFILTPSLRMTKTLFILTCCLLFSVECSSPDVLQTREPVAIDSELILAVYSNIDRENFNADIIFENASVKLGYDTDAVKSAFIERNMLPIFSGHARGESDSLNIEEILSEIELSAEARTYLTMMENIISEDNEVDSPENLAEALEQLTSIEQMMLTDPALSEAEAESLLSSVVVIETLLPEIAEEIAEQEGLDSSNGRLYLFKNLWKKVQSVFNHVVAGAAVGAFVGFFIAGGPGALTGAVIGGGSWGTWGLILTGPGICFRYKCGYYDCDSPCISQ